MAVSVSTQKLFRTVVVRCKPPVEKKILFLLRVRVKKSRNKTNMKRNNLIFIGL